MSAQELLERLAQLQLREQEQKTLRATYEAESARLQMEYVRSQCADARKTPIERPS